MVAEFQKQALATRLESLPAHTRRLLLTAAAIFSLLGNISGGMTGSTRTTYARGRDRLLPTAQ